MEEERVRVDKNENELRMPKKIKQLSSKIVEQNHHYVLERKNKN